MIKHVFLACWLFHKILQKKMDFSNSPAAGGRLDSKNRDELMSQLKMQLDLKYVTELLQVTLYFQSQTMNPLNHRGQFHNRVLNNTHKYINNWPLWSKLLLNYGFTKCMHGSKLLLGLC